jgi:phospholipid transport system substrate-binding protein
MKVSSPSFLRGALGATFVLCFASLAFAAEPTAPAKKAAPAKATAKVGAPAADAPAARGASTPPADSSPLADLKKSNAQLRKVLQKQSPTWSPTRDVRTAEVRKVVGQFLDFEELARRALAKHWETLNAKQRADFVTTLRDLVERNYLNQIHGGQADYDLVFDKEEKKDNEASVTATLNTTAKGKKVTVALDHKMIYKDGRWVVYDVITDEQSLLETYRAEFNKIINRDGFDALLKRMKKKLADKPE